MDYNDILRRMREGVSSDDIAHEMAEMLNRAEKQIAEESKTAKREKDFQTACKAAADAFNYALDAYGQIVDKDMCEFYLEAESCENMIKMIDSIGGLISMFAVDNDTKPGPTEVKNYSGDIDFDRAVEEFFKKYNIT